jgi:AraC-like DNA-binding protein/CheY-like chemotaxis protein
VGLSDLEDKRLFRVEIMNSVRSHVRTALILVIDPSDRKWDSGVFASLGQCEVVHAADSAEGVGHFIHNLFDVSILCMNDPKQCIDIIRFFKSARPSFPIIVISNHSSEDFVISALRADAWDFFKEPAEEADIVDSIRQALQFKYDGGWANGNDHPIWRALKYINEHLMDHISLEETARECGMSLSCFERAFKREVGMTFNKYVNSLRISKARQLLHENNKSMSEIAFACGYTNQYHFTRTFKKLMNTPPRTFRKSLLHQPSPKTISA